MVVLEVCVLVNLMTHIYRQDIVRQYNITYHQSQGFKKELEGIYQDRYFQQGRWVVLSGLENKFINMYGGVSYNKKPLKRKEEERLMEGHLQRIKNVRPNTTGFVYSDQPRSLNNGKKQMLNEDKFTQIQRENRLLLQKITNQMNKRSHSVSEKERASRSLHGSFRKKQLENIEIQNARLLRRLQEKRSSYQTQKLNDDWKKQKEVIKNIASFPLVIKDGSKRQRKRQIHKPINLNFDKNMLGSDIEMMRIRNIDGVTMVVTAKLNNEQLTIVGDLKASKSIKIIQIPRDQAMEFIQMECQGKLENIFDRLRYDHTEQTLYLVSQGADYRDIDEADEAGQSQQK